VKPSEWGNRGCGIRIYNNAEEVASRVDSKEKVWVIQKYIERPLLIHKRKFDIRAYCLVTQEPSAGAWRVFSYRDAYLRTTSVKYTTKRLDRMAHLNNDAVQKHGEDYGKFESANKMSLEEWQRYLDEHHARDGVSVRQRIMPQVRGLMADAVRAAAPKLNARGIPNCFEVYGFDFMVDAGFRVWLIECNANPCLDLCCSYLSHLIPTMLDQALFLTVDRIFTPHASKSAWDHGGECGTKWDIIFDSSQERWPPEAVSCSWVESLPEEGQGFDRAGCAAMTLGRQILCDGHPRKKSSAAKTCESRRSDEKLQGRDEEVEEEENAKEDDEEEEEEEEDEDEREDAKESEEDWDGA